MLRAVGRATAAVALATRLLAQFSTPNQAIGPDVLHSPGRQVAVSLLTVGNGNQVWQMFGHSAMWLRDTVTGRDTVFNWGVFDSSKPYFIPHFLQGLMIYRMGGGTVSQILYEAQYFNRSVTLQELDLSAAQKDSLLQLIRINAQPEHVEYRYDYFRENCSTRPRDLLDQVLDGQLRAQSSKLMPTSYRWHALRLMQGNRLLTLGVDIGLGESADRRITKWDEMFLPREVHDVVATMQVRDSAGGMRALLKRERVLFAARRPPEPATPPNHAPWLLAIGLTFAGLFVWVGSPSTTRARAGRIAAAVLYSAWAAAAGLLGVVLTLLWTITDHTYAHANENLMLFNPLWLVLAVSLPMYMVSGRLPRLTSAIASIVAALGVIELLAHLGLSAQTNLAVIGLALPPSLALAWVTRRSVIASRDATKGSLS